MRYEYDAVIHVEPDGGAYVVFPWDLRQTFGLPDGMGNTETVSGWSEILRRLIDEGAVPPYRQ